MRELLIEFKDGREEQWLVDQYEITEYELLVYKDNYKHIFGVLLDKIESILETRQIVEEVYYNEA